MEVCKDCLKSEEIVSKGLCRRCYTRRQNFKHRQITGEIPKDKIFVPYKDLSKKEQAKFDKRSKANTKGASTKRNSSSVDSTKIVRDTKSDEDLIDIKSQDNIVFNDIQETFKEHNAIWPKDTNSILPVFQQLNVLLNDYINTYLIAEDILNKMELDYKHAKEYYNTLYKELVLNKSSKSEIKLAKEKKDLWEERHSALLERRRGIKNVLAEYNAGGILFTELGTDKVFMKKFNDYFEGLQKVNTIVSQRNYRAEVSKLVSEEDFVIGFKSDTTVDGQHKYQVIVRTLYKGSTSNFVRNVWANSEEDAKQQVIKFIEADKEKFRFSFKSNDIIVNRLDKDCL